MSTEERAELKVEKLQIKLPADPGIQLKNLPKKGRHSVLMVLFFLVPAIILGASLLLFLFSSSAHFAYPFELGRFSGTAEIYSHKTKQWTTVTRRSHRQIILYAKDRIRTLSDSDLDFRIPNALDLRLKASSEMELMKTRYDEELKFKLIKGGLLGMTDDQFGNRKLEVTTPRFNAMIQNQGSFLIQTGKADSSAAALSGQIIVKAPRSRKAVLIKPLEILTQDDKNAPFKAKRVNYQEWKTVGEVRDLTVVTAEKVAEQIDLRKKAGTLFKYVFDEGVFFKPNWGYAEREFYEDSESKQVMLRIDYDVFPQNSFSGMYFKTRDLDLSKVHRISFDVKSDSQKPIPSQFRIELKDQLATVRGFSVKPISKEWKHYTFEFNAPKPVSVGEVVFVFENSRIGALNTNGTIYVKDLMIE